MKRGDLVTVSAPGDYGKPRPAVVVQSDCATESGSVLVALMTTTLRDVTSVRLLVEPASHNALRAPSQVMVDKIMAVPREKCGPALGRLASSEIATLNERLALVLGLAD